MTPALPRKPKPSLDKQRARRPDFPLASRQWRKVGRPVQKEAERIDGQRRRGFRTVELAASALIAGSGVENRLDLRSGHARQESFAHPLVPSRSGYTGVRPSNSFDISGPMVTVPIRQPEYRTVPSIAISLPETQRRREDDDGSRAIQVDERIVTSATVAQAEIN